MLKRLSLSFLLVSVFCSMVGLRPVLAQSTEKTNEIRARIDKYGVGKKVSVTLKDGTKYKGKIKTITRDGFSILDRKQNKTQTFTFSEVRKVKKSSYTKWIILGVVAGAAAAVIIPLSARCRNEGANALCL